MLCQKNIYCLFGTLKMQIDLIDTKLWLVCRYIQESARLRSRGRETQFGPYTRKCLNLMYGPGECRNSKVPAAVVGGGGFC